MCKASIDAPNAKDGTPNSELKIGTNEYGMGVATTQHSAGSGQNDDSNNGATATAACTVCLHTGAQLLLTKMPRDLRTVLGLSSDESMTAIFIETPGDHDFVIHDLVAFPERPELGQVRFASLCGATATLVTAPNKYEMTAEEAIGQAAETIAVIDGEDPLEALKIAVGLTAHSADTGATETQPRALQDA